MDLEEMVCVGELVLDYLAKDRDKCEHVNGSITCGEFHY
jgi:hypothetical protein